MLIIYMYVCICIYASVCCKEKKKRTKLAFQIKRRRSIWPGEEKTIQARKSFQYKSVKA